MATQIVTGEAPSAWQDTWEAIDTCLLQATGIVDLLNVPGNENQNAAWAAQDLLIRAHELHEVLREQVQMARSEGAIHG